MDQKFSIIVTTNRGMDQLEPLFRSTDKNSELIITTSKYDEDIKGSLKSYIGKYNRIIYAPIRKRRFTYAKDCIAGMNEAFMYAEEDWLIRADDNLEFKEDFFDKCREDLDYFQKMMGHSNFGIIGQKLWGQLNHQKWNDYFQQKGSRYIEVNQPEFTFSFGILPIEMVYNLNGYLGLYDLGWGFEEEDFLLRGMVSGYKYYFDREMMGYSEPHEPHRESFSFNKTLYELQRLEILSGKTRAYNDYDIRIEQNRMLAIKDDYRIE